MIHLHPGDEVTVTLVLHLALPDGADVAYLDDDIADQADYEIDPEFVRIQPTHGGETVFELVDLTAIVGRPNPQATFTKAQP